jgi:hypothetical protein
MGPVNRTLLPLGLVLCTVVSLAKVHTARGQDGWYDGPALGADYFSGADVWGRVNPAFCGFPTFSVATDVVVLGRSTPADQTIVFDGSVNPLLDANDFGTPDDAGARINLTFFDHWNWDFMLDMLFMGEMVSRQRFDASGGVNLFFYQGVAVDPVNTAEMRSDLDTGELNARRRFGPNFALLLGVRYLELSENLDFFSASTSSSAYRSQSDNRLIGGQIGAEGVVPLWGYGRLFATGKTGIYNNRFQVAAQAMSGGAPISIAVRDDMAAYVSEANIGWEVQTVPCMTLRFGYQGFWLQNMALTTDQLNQYSIFTADGSVRKGFAGFHGWFGGLAFTF